MKLNNGGDGFIGQKAYVIFWPVEELSAMNWSYDVERYAPGLLIFGSDGGGEAYGFDTRAPQLPIVQVPFVGMAWDIARAVGASFNVFLAHLSGGNEMDDANRSSQRSPSLSHQDKEIFEITPVIIGGHPTDPENKMLLSREDHITAVRYWNKIIAELRAKGPARGLAEWAEDILREGDAFLKEE